MPDRDQNDFHLKVVKIISVTKGWGVNEKILDLLLESQFLVFS